jgi:serine/threonine protein kinase
LNHCSLIWPFTNLTYQRPVPEHFVWHYLDQMTHALLTLQDGICRQPHDLEPAVVEGDDVGAARSWASLLYGDIKPHNIFCAEGNEPYPSYPRVLLADFDSVQKSDKDPGRHAGTPLWQPPVSCGCETKMHHIKLTQS